MTLLPLPLPPQISSRMVPDVNGLDVHILEAGATGRPCVVLLHGFPELAYSWRAVMPALAEAGCHVIAPDLRGFGRTTGGDARFDGDVDQYRQLNLLTDLMALLRRLAIGIVTCVVGHDLGSQLAGYAALIRPDVFASVVLMSAPFIGPPSLPTGDQAPAPARVDLDEALSRLDRPRKHYTRYYSTAAADADMSRPPQGLSDFLRAYFHVKSGDWAENAPFPLAGPTAEAFTKLPTYYVMDRAEGMAATVAPAMPSSAEIAACRWLPEEDLAVFAAEYGRTGFQGGLQWYRTRTGPEHVAELRLFSGRTVDVPAAFIAGARDWGVHQTPGALEAMRTRVCTRMTDCHLIPGAGHWVQQEATETVSGLLKDFLAANSPC